MFYGHLANKKSTRRRPVATKKSNYLVASWLAARWSVTVDMLSICSLVLLIDSTVVFLVWFWVRSLLMPQIGLGKLYFSKRKLRWISLFILQGKYGKGWRNMRSKSHHSFRCADIDVWSLLLSGKSLFFISLKVNPIRQLNSRCTLPYYPMSVFLFLFFFPEVVYIFFLHLLLGWSASAWVVWILWEDPC